MNHPTADELLLFASGELTELRLVEVASHLATCATCQGALTQIEGSLVAFDAARPYRALLLTRRAAWAGVALAAAATVAVVLIWQPGETRPSEAWVPTTTWSVTAGYVAGGKALMDIDAQLTQLEQESYYGRP